MFLNTFQPSKDPVLAGTGAGRMAPSTSTRISARLKHVQEHNSRAPHAPRFDEPSPSASAAHTPSSYASFTTVRHRHVSHLPRPVHKGFYLDTLPLYRNVLSQHQPTSASACDVSRLPRPAFDPYARSLRINIVAKMIPSVAWNSLILVVATPPATSGACRPRIARRHVCIP